MLIVFYISGHGFGHASRDIELIRTLFALNKDEWLKKYHLRSNSEATFSGVKRKFGASVRSKNLDAQLNEEAQHAEKSAPHMGGILGKILSHVQSPRP